MGLGSEFVMDGWEVGNSGRPDAIRFAFAWVLIRGEW